MTKQMLLSLNPLTTDLHMHTCYCDGKDTPEQMIKSAIAKGLTTVGVLAHSYVSFDDYCIKRSDIPKMKSELDALKAELSDKIQVLYGVELDYYSDESADMYDYAIGSVHYFKFGNDYPSVDLSREVLVDVARDYFGGDMLALSEHYFTLVGGIVKKTGAQIVGHLDLITKFNKDGTLIDTSDERYVRAYRSAVDELIADGAVFEINTGAMSRGYTDEPYPSREICEYIRSQGGCFILSSDAHRADSIAFGFDSAKDLL